MYMRKSNGPSTVSWGTPETTLAQVERSPPTTNLCLRHLRKFEIQVCVLLWMPYLFNLFRSRLWGTVSNAFEKSIIIMSVWDLLFKELARSCVVSINCDSVECFLRKIAYWSKWFMMLENTMCSRILQHIDVRRWDDSLMQGTGLPS